MKEQTIAQKLKVKDFPFTIKDGEGNDIYKENENGYWERWEYDKNQDVILEECSNGFWTKMEYDDMGREIYYETSDGYVSDNRPIHVSELKDGEFARVHKDWGDDYEGGIVQRWGRHLIALGKNRDQSWTDVFKPSELALNKIDHPQTKVVRLKKEDVLKKI